MTSRTKSPCRHCGQPVEQGKDLFSMWFHSRRYIDSTNRRCDPSDANSTLALPRVEVVKPESGRKRTAG